MLTVTWQHQEVQTKINWLRWLYIEAKVANTEAIVKYNIVCLCVLYTTVATLHNPHTLYSSLPTALTGSSHGPHCRNHHFCTSENCPIHFSRRHVASCCRTQFAQRVNLFPSLIPSEQVIVRLLPSTTVTAAIGSMVTVWATETPNTPN